MADEMNKTQFKNALLETEVIKERLNAKGNKYLTKVANSINTEMLVVVNSRGKYLVNEVMAKEYNQKKIDKLNYITNFRLNRYSLKKNSKFPRVKFYAFTEYAIHNNHGHIFLDTAGHKFDDVVKIMREEWVKLEDRDTEHDIYTDKIDNENAYAEYCVKDFTKRSPETYKVM